MNKVVAVIALPFFPVVVLLDLYLQAWLGHRPSLREACEVTWHSWVEEFMG